MRGHDGTAAPAIWLDTPAPESWAEEAECRRFPELASYFTEAATVEEGAVGLTICRECPVQQACLDYGMSLRADGVWGGQLLQHGRIRSRAGRSLATFPGARATSAHVADALRAVAGAGAKR